MCGRIAQAHTPDELTELFGFTEGADNLREVRASYNLPPSQLMPALVPFSDSAAWRSFTWGIEPKWKGRPVINARSETVAEKPFFRRSFQERRCVVPATAYYEWRVRGEPWCIRPREEEPLLLAGIYSRDQCVVLTRAAHPDLAFIHDRMPVAMPREMLLPWLHDEGAAPHVFAAALDLPLRAYRVSRGVGSPRFNSPACLEALPE